MKVRLNKARRFLLDDIDISKIPRIHSILSYNGVKPSTLFPYRGILDLDSEFKKFVIEGKVKEYNRNHYVGFIGKNRRSLTKVMKSFTLLNKLIDVRNSSEEWESEFDKVSYDLGIVLGYPETSIKAYLGELERSKRKDPRCLALITCYVRSEEFYDEEMKVALAWKDHIKSNYPEFYSSYSKSCLR